MDYKTQIKQNSLAELLAKIRIVRLVKNKGVSQIDTATSELEDSLASKEEEIESLKEDKTKLKKDKENLKGTINSKETKISQADKYNDILVYLSNLIKEHDSLVEWSEAEYKEVRRLALATENDDIVERVDWVNDRRDIGLLVRHYELLSDITTSLDQTLD